MARLGIELLDASIVEAEESSHSVATNMAAAKPIAAQRACRLLETIDSWTGLVDRDL
jgi:hypothetical protein